LIYISGIALERPGSTVQTGISHLGRVFKTTSSYSKFSLFYNMDSLRLLFLILSTIVLFLFSLQGFSKEVQLLGAGRLQAWLGRVTRNRFGGFALGAVFTALVQSSSAVSSMAVGLVDAGVMGLQGSLAVMLGTNVGTTFTAWMVSFKITFIGPVFLVLGAAMSTFSGPFKASGKAVFYLGFIFFSLDLISESLQPLREHPDLVHYLSKAHGILPALLTGMLVTVFVQSSSVTTGMVVLLVQQGLLPLESAVAMAMGANVGTTSTALLAALKLNIHAKRAAMANFAFNLSGTLLLLPFFYPFVEMLGRLQSDPAMAVATGHLFLNFGMALLYLPFTGWLAALLVRWMPAAEKPIQDDP
jgi:phosphate:Na+ symporter